MSDAAKLAAVFRAAADGLAHDCLAQFDAIAANNDRDTLIIIYGTTERSELVRRYMQQRLRDCPIQVAQWMAFDGVATVFERVVKASEVPQHEVPSEDDVIAYAVKKDGVFLWSATNKGAVERFARERDGTLHELIERPNGKASEQAAST